MLQFGNRFNNVVDGAVSIGLLIRNAVAVRKNNFI